MNRATRAREKGHALAGLLPIDFMLSKLRDERAPLKVRMWAAQTAAPYIHPKLAMVDARVWDAMNRTEAITSADVDPATLSYDEREAIRAVIIRTVQALTYEEPETIDGDFSERAA